MPHQSMALLAWWEELLHACYRGQAEHPVFTALADTIRRFEIPPDPFVDLLVAFRQDQRVTHYETFDQLLNYCRYSANPVGRLVLYLGQCHTPQRARLADSISTGLQLANFWQDVARDWDHGRIYLPLAHCRRFEYEEADFGRREANDNFRRLLAAEVDEADGFLRRGCRWSTGCPTSCVWTWPCSSKAAWPFWRPFAGGNTTCGRRDPRWARSRNSSWPYAAGGNYAAARFTPTSLSNLPSEARA